jgi:hypothetical protein
MRPESRLVAARSAAPLTPIGSKLYGSPMRKLDRYLEATMPEPLENIVSLKGTDKADKRDKFVELAQNRTKNAIKAIRVIGKLGNKNAYDFTEADVNKIAKALIREVELMKARMSTKGGKESVDFAL